jgi:hypothetical protein
MKQIVELEQRTNKAPLTGKQTLAADYKNHRAAILYLGRIDTTEVEAKASVRIQQEADFITARIDEERRKEAARIEAERVAEEKRKKAEAARIDEERRKEAERVAEEKTADLKNAALHYLRESGYEWQFLDVDVRECTVLVIAKDCVARKPYHELRDAITWEYSSLSRWLNTDFLNSLPEAMRACICEVTLKNPSNPKNGTVGGNDTRNRIFLLSIEEARRYFPNDKARVSKYEGKAYWWWLRSPGIVGFRVAFVLDGGGVSAGGSNVDSSIGVRPALWLNLQSENLLIPFRRRAKPILSLQAVAKFLKGD